MGAVMDEPTGSCCIQTAIARFTARHSRWSSRVQPRAFERLELLIGKPVRTVLRGRDYSNVILLPGGDEETGLCRPRLVATQLHSPSGKEHPDIPCLRCQPVERKPNSCCGSMDQKAHPSELDGNIGQPDLPYVNTGEPRRADGAASNTPPKAFRLSPSC